MLARLLLGLISISCTPGGEGTDAVAALEARGARVSTPHEAHGRPCVHVTIEKGWSGTPEDLSLLRKVPNLGRIVIQDVDLPEEACLKVLRDFPALEALSLDFTNVTDEGLRELEKLPALRALSLQHVNISDEALERLRQANAQLRINLND